MNPVHFFKRQHLHELSLPCSISLSSMPFVSSLKIFPCPSLIFPPVVFLLSTDNENWQSCFPTDLIFTLRASLFSFVHSGIFLFLFSLQVWFSRKCWVSSPPAQQAVPRPTPHSSPAPPRSTSGPIPQAPSSRYICLLSRLWSIQTVVLTKDVKAN